MLCRFLSFICLVLLLNPFFFAQEKELYQGKEFKDAFANPEDTKLPNVLLIGDSISIGYTIHVRKLLKGKADVFRISENGRYSAYGIENLDKWLGDKKWDVIHFNWGLWDVAYRSADGKTRDKVKGKITATPEEYGKNLQTLVNKLKKTEAKLIWCNITPVPEGEEGRIVGDDLVYNKVAEEVMTKNKIHINDLHAHALKNISKIQLKHGDVHFTPKGYEYLAEKVVAEITAKLAEK